MKNDIKISDTKTIFYLLKNEDYTNLSSFFQEYSKILLAKILSLVKDRTLADDLLQETWIRTMHSIRTQNDLEVKNFKSWILTIAQNCCYAHFRKIKSRTVISTNDCDLNRNEYSLGLFDEILFKDETTQRKRDNLSPEYLRNLIEMLPPSQRDPIILRFFQNCSLKEIQQKLGPHVKYTTYFQRIKYGYLKLKNSIQKLELNDMT